MAIFDRLLEFLGLSELSPVESRMRRVSEPPVTDPVTQFMLEEYRNIANTHDRLREIISRLFNYFLILSAVPFTVAGVVFGRDPQTTFDLFDAPDSIYALSLVVGVGHLFLALASIDARLGQYRYARTVNLIRSYFANRDQRLVPFLYLPTTEEAPRWEDLGFVGTQVLFMVVVGVLFVAYSAYGLIEDLPWRIVSPIIIGSAYLLFYWAQRRRLIERYQRRSDLERPKQPPAKGPG